MSNYSNLREDFLAEVVRAGWREPSQLPPTQSVIPAHIAALWLRRLYRQSKAPQARGQLVNHYLVGSDPEFYFLQGGGRAAANDLNLKAGLAWGADNNGRLAEMRPHPSRSTLAVVASLASELRWMSWLRPDLSLYSWHGGAWNHQDGLGGHIHFGRLKNREREVAALDLLAYWLSQIGVFDQVGWRERIRRKAYGKLGDVRAQRWGWEYRTFPSWIDSPWLAFFTLTLSKLMVFDPEIWHGIRPAQASAEEVQILPAQIRDRITSLLAYYQHRDDDAQLAYSVLMRRGFPQHDQADFRPRWGLFAPPPNLPKVDVIPGSIAPTPDEIKEMASSLLDGRAPDPVSFEPNWHPSQLPSPDYYYLPSETQTYHAPGLGELVVGLAGFRKLTPKLDGVANDGKRLYISEALIHKFQFSKHWKRQLQAVIPGIDIRDSDGKGISISTGFDWKREGPALRRWLLNGSLPIWRVEELEKDSIQQFEKRQIGKLAPAVENKFSVAVVV